VINAREKRRADVRGVTPVRGIPMRERAYNFNAHFIIGRLARTVLYLLYNCLYCHATRRKLKLKLSKMRMIYSEKYYACGPIPRAWANPRDTKNALVL
jgi:hypothetical protein